MNKLQFEIDFKEERLPYNTRLVLDLQALQKISAPLKEEILHGLVDTMGEECIVLHIQLDPEKLKMVQVLSAELYKQTSACDPAGESIF